jgi:hypothetical protein
MTERYNIDYTFDEVAEILNLIQNHVKNNRFYISKINRDDNNEFIMVHNISFEDRKRILLQIKPEDFCYSTPNEHIGYESESLYVFCPLAAIPGILDNNDNLRIEMYIKFNIVEAKGTDRVIVVSFHSRKKPINYLFRGQNKLEMGATNEPDVL